MRVHFIFLFTGQTLQTTISAFTIVHKMGSGLIYFGGHQNTSRRENSSHSNMGSLEAFPFIKLSGDDNIGDWDGDNEEQLDIAHLKE